MIAKNLRDQVIASTFSKMGEKPVDEILRDELEGRCEALGEALGEVLGKAPGNDLGETLEKSMKEIYADILEELEGFGPLR